MAASDPVNLVAIPGGFSGALHVQLIWSSPSDPDRTAYVIERRSRSGSDWVQLDFAPVDAVSYFDFAVEANEGYAYRVGAYTTQGAPSDYATVDYWVYTTPAPPTSVSVGVVVANSRVSVRYDASGAPWATGVEIEVAVGDGDAPDDWGGTVDGPVVDGILPVTVDVPSGPRVRARVRSVVEFTGEGRGGVEARYVIRSDWAYSDTVDMSSPPLAPKLFVGPAVTSGAFDLIVVPDHPDGSSVTGAQYGTLSPSGVASDGHDIDGLMASFTPDERGRWGFRARTKGADPDWGPWSGYVYATSADAPQVVVTSPPYDGWPVQSLPVDLAWEVTDANGVSDQLLTITDAGGRVVWQSEPDTSQRLVRLGVGDVALESGETYTLAVRVRNGVGLESTRERTFAVSWVAPAPPHAAPTVDRTDASVTVNVVPTTATGLPPAAGFFVDRRNPDGTLWRLGSLAGDGGSLVDPLPPIGVPYSYVVTAWADSGARSTSEASCVVDLDLAAISFGDEAGETVLAELRPSWSQSVSRSGTLYDFADGGERGGLPVPYEGPSVSSKRSLGFALLSADDMRRLQRLAAAHFTCRVRDPFGGRALGSVSWSLSAKTSHGPIDVTLDMTECGWEEAW